MKSVNTIQPSSGRRAFTLVEMLIVIGVILLIITLLVPMIGKALATASRTRAAADLQTIGSGLDAYKLDHKSYPRYLPGTSVPGGGAVLLCWALIAPGPAEGNPGVADGADGPGFRIRGKQGHVYGPYINVENFRLIDVTTKSKPIAPPNDSQTAITDRYGTPIYYCPASLLPSPGAPHPLDIDLNDGVTPRPMFDFNYFNGATSLTLPDAQQMMTDTPATTAPYLLWSAGANGVFGYDPPGKTKSDDVTNFRN